MIGPTHRGYDEGDPSLDHQYREHEIVSVVLLFVFTILLPIIFFILMYFFLFQSAHDLHNALLGVLSSVSFAEIITDFTKLGGMHAYMHESVQSLDTMHLDMYACMNVFIFTIAHHMGSFGDLSLDSGSSSP
jgi:hypothetical protein